MATISKTLNPVNLVMDPKSLGRGEGFRSGLRAIVAPVGP